MNFGWIISDLMRELKWIEFTHNSSKNEKKVEQFTMNASIVNCHFLMKLSLTTTHAHVHYKHNICETLNRQKNSNNIIKIIKRNTWFYSFMFLSIKIFVENRESRKKRTTFLFSPLIWIHSKITESRRKLHRNQFLLYLCMCMCVCIVCVRIIMVLFS